MSTIITNYTENLVSLGYYGQTPARQDYPEEFAKPHFTPQEPETYTEMCKRYVWTILPLMTLVKPVDSAVTVISELAKIAKSVDAIMKLRSLSYNAFQTVLSAGMIATTVIEPFSPLVRRLFMGIQLLSLANQTALRLYRFDGDNEKSFKVDIHVLSNLVAMAALISQNLFVTCIFFCMQSSIAFITAINHFSKKKYLAASVDAFMGCFRFFQAYQVLKDYFGVREIPKPIKKQLIDSREPIKEQLTKQEEKLKNLCGEEYLYFKQNGPEEKFLILSAEFDHNGALDPKRIKPLIDQLSKRFDVKFRTISVVEDIPREITSAVPFGPVTGLMLNAHGTQQFILLSYALNGQLSNETITPDLFSGLDPRCVIALPSCDAASYPYFSVAHRVANRSHRVTFAPDTLCYGITLEQLDPLEFSFKTPAKTKKIQPLENDSFIAYLKSFFTFKKETILVQNNSNPD